MKLTLKTKNVKEILKKAKKIYDKKTIKPILETVLFTEFATAVVSDYKNIETTFYFDILDISDERENFCVDLITLKKTVDKIKSPEFEIEYRDNRCVIKFKKVEIELPTKNADDFPRLKKNQPNSDVITVKKDDIQKALEKTLFCACSDELIYNLHGILFEFEKNILTLVTSDGYRLGVFKIDAVSNVEKKVLLPLKAAQELYNSIKYSKDAKISLHVYSKYLSTQINEKSLLHFQIMYKDASFPQYKMILPENFETEITISKKQALETMELASVIFSGKGDTIKFEMNGKIEVKSRSENTASFKAELNGVKTGMDNTIAFDPVFLREGFKTIDGDRVKMSFVDANNAMVMTEIDNDNYQHLIMPVKIRS